jgi:hypothetical protein
VAFPEVTPVLIPSPVKQPVMTEPTAHIIDYSGQKGRAWTPPSEPEAIPPADPFIEAVQATLQPAPAGTRRVYFGGGL